MHPRFGGQKTLPVRTEDGGPLSKALPAKRRGAPIDVVLHVGPLRRRYLRDCLLGALRPRLRCKSTVAVAPR